MPYLPLAGILVNYFLIAQLSWIGLLLLVCYFGLATLHYIFYCLNQNESASYRMYEKCVRHVSKSSDDEPLVVSQFNGHGGI